MSQPTQSLEVEAPPPANYAGTTRWGIVGLLMAFCFISHMNRASMFIAGDDYIMPRHGLTPVQMGWVYSAFLISYMAFMVPAGLFIDRFGPRLALVAMGLSTAVLGGLTGLTALAAAGQIWFSLLLVRSVMGVFTTPLHPSCAQAVGTWVSPARRALANGFVTGAALFGNACVAPIFGALSDRVGWPVAFVLLAAITALVAIAWFWSTRAFDRPAADKPARSGDGAGWKMVLTSRSVWVLTLSYGAIGYFQYLFFYWLHYYFEHVMRMDKIESRYATALPMLAMAFTMPIGGWLSDRFQARYGPRLGRSLFAGAAMIAAALFLWPGQAAKAPLWTVVWFTAALGTLGLAEAAFWQTAVELGSAHGGTVAAVMNTGGNGIGLLAPVVTPWVASNFGWPAAIGLGGLISVLGGLCWLWIRLHSHTNQKNTS